MESGMPELTLSGSSNPPLGGRQHPARAGGRGRLQDLHLPAAVLQAHLRRLRRGVRRRAGRVRRRPGVRPLPENHRFQIPEGCHWNDVRAVDRKRRPGAPEGDARDREGQPGHPLRHLRRRPVDQQGAPLRCPAPRPDRALLPASPGQPAGPGRHPRPGLRVPDQEVRRRHQQEGRRVLHPALRGAADGQHPRPAGGRDHLRPRLRHRRHAAGGRPPRQGAAAATTARSGASSSARRRT